jgi:hypothetical protein
MNLKVVHLVAIQFGMFAGIMGWLAYSQLPFGEPRSEPKAREPIAEPVATFASAPNPADQRPQTVDYRAGQEQTRPVAERPAPAMQHEYSAAAVQQNSDLAAQLYYQQIAPRRHASSGLTNNPTAAVAPSYVIVAPEPAAVQGDDPVPETVAYVQPTEVVVYPQPQFVVFDNSRRFANRSRSTFRNPGTPLANAHRQSTLRNPGTPLANVYRDLDRPRSHLIGSTVCPPAKSFGVVHRRNDSVPSCRPNQAFAGRGRR